MSLRDFLKDNKKSVLITGLTVGIIGIATTVSLIIDHFERKRAEKVILTLEDRRPTIEQLRNGISVRVNKKDFSVTIDKTESYLVIKESDDGILCVAELDQVIRTQLQGLKRYNELRENDKSYAPESYLQELHSIAFDDYYAPAVIEYLDLLKELRAMKKIDDKTYETELNKAEEVLNVTATLSSNVKRCNPTKIKEEFCTTNQ